MKKPPAFLVFLFAVFLSACQANAPATKINVELSDFAITPNQLVVPAGSEITVLVTNLGSVVHDINIMEFGVDVGDKFDEEDRPNIYWEVEIQPDGTETVIFMAPDRPGVYQIICGMPGHLQAGMRATLEVVE